MLHPSKLLHSLWILIAALFVSACTGPSKAAEPQTCVAAQVIKPALIRSNNPAKMSILYGSGMWIHTPKGDNYFVTNAHVVMKPKYAHSNVHAVGPKIVKPYLHGKVYIHNETFDYVEAEVVAISQNSRPFTLKGHGYFAVHRDVAILKAKEMPSSFTKHLTQHKVKATHDEGFGYLTGFRPYGRDYQKEIGCYNTINGKKATYLLHPTEKSIPGQSGSGMLNSKFEITGLLSNSGSLDKPDNGKDNIYFSRIAGGVAYFGVGEPQDPNDNVYGIATPGIWILRLLELAP